MFSTTSNSSTNAGPFSIALKGSGRSFILGSGQYVTPLIIDFGPVGVGFNSPTQAATITNQSWINTITGWAGGGVNAPFHAGALDFSFKLGPIFMGTQNTSTPKFCHDNGTNDDQCILQASAR